MNDNNKIEKINQLDIYVLDIYITQLRAIFKDINNFIDVIGNKKLINDAYKYSDIIYYSDRILEKLDNLKNDMKGTLSGGEK